ncbi:MAG TPA: WhiB family transcriptional regulator [Pseudonocardia sp.]|nr:WhiB family transcriptional regulator [Pseudonocardia sp.]
MRHYDDWRQRAACRDEDPELFFPLSEVGPGARQADRAKALCARCPVATQCLEYALGNGLDHGIFGGTTETERRALRRRAGTVHPAA